MFWWVWRNMFDSVSFRNERNKMFKGLQVHTFFSTSQKVWRKRWPYGSWPRFLRCWILMEKRDAPLKKRCICLGWSLLTRHWSMTRKTAKHLQYAIEVWMRHDQRVFVFASTLEGGPSLHPLQVNRPCLWLRIYFSMAFKSVQNSVTLHRFIYRCCSWSFLVSAGTSNWFLLD